MIRVEGHTIDDRTIDAAFERWKDSGKLTLMSMKQTLAYFGVPWDLCDRAADRILQAKRKEGVIKRDGTSRVWAIV